ncbi:hypothetical protein HK097_005538 [Rhizophlyctis rosea]|uniref:Uncharacterized protein n=1 Tax=Rhizophlyctis rosea TaxID=64517 RepID=A0AAD5SJ69_9FUNG|nr:hypothetical protein HK097_005538 [Rhizophlyctis rosea]
MTSENRRAQDEAETDDHFYLDPSNPTAADDAFQQYRHGFYRLFAYRQLKKQQTSKTKKKGKKFTMPEAKPPQDIYEVDEFVNYLTNVKWDMRTTVGLLMWERDNTLDMEDEEDRKVKRRKRISSVSLWRLWSYFSAVLPLAVWELLLKPKASPTDLVQWPGLFRIVVISLASGFGMRTWLKLLHFEVQALVWTDPWQHGLVFYDVGGGMLIGMLFP